MKNRTEHKERQHDSHQHGYKGSYDQVNGIRHMPTEPLFKFCSKNAGDKCREHGALIACHPDKAKENQRFCRAGTHVIGTGQRRIDQHQAKHNTNDRISAEITEGGPAYQRRQERERRIGQDLRDFQKILRDAFRRHAEDPKHCILCQKSPKAHKQTGCHQHRNDRDEHIREHADRSLKTVAVYDRFFLFTGLRPACNLYDFVIHTVDQTGAEDDLILAGVKEGTLYPIQRFHCVRLDLILIRDDDSKPCGTMPDRDDIAFSAHQLYDFFCQLLFIHILFSSCLSFCFGTLFMIS